MWQNLASARHKMLWAAAILIIIGVLLIARPVLTRINGLANQPTPLEASDSASVPADDAFAFDEEPASPEPSAIEPTAATDAVVYISGAVQHPDVYRVPAQARVKDVVVAAGGLSDDAAAEQINLAEHIADAQHIHIPRRGEAMSVPTNTSSSAPAAEQSELININTASLSELDQLTGVGAVLAQRIIDYRVAHGPFQSIDELRKVQGIGSALFAKITPNITAGP